MLYDLLVVALLAKLVCEVATAKMSPWQWGAFWLLSLPFLLGLSRETGLLRNGVAAVGLAVFLIALAEKGADAAFTGFLGFAVMAYLLGRWARQRFIP